MKLEFVYGGSLRELLKREPKILAIDNAVMLVVNQLYGRSSEEEKQKEKREEENKKESKR